MTDGVLELKMTVEVKAAPAVKRTAVGLKVTVRPVEGRAVPCERATLPANKPRLLTVAVRVPI
jgi:hypothetical protein